MQKVLKLGPKKKLFFGSSLQRLVIFFFNKKCFFFLEYSEVYRDKFFYSWMKSENLIQERQLHPAPVV